MKLALVIFLITATSVQASENCAKSPLEALKILTDAYKSKNVNKAINAFDFNEVAKTASKMAGVEIPAKELLDSYKQGLINGDFPSYEGLTCELSQKQIDKLVVVQEKCNFDSGKGSITQSVIAVKTKCGWKLGGAYMPNKASQPTQKPRG